MDQTDNSEFRHKLSLPVTPPHTPPFNLGLSLSHTCLLITTPENVKNRQTLINLPFLIC